MYVLKTTSLPQLLQPLQEVLVDKYCALKKEFATTGKKDENMVRRRAFCVYDYSQSRDSSIPCFPTFLSLC
jgi:hypothetical protein